MNFPDYLKEFEADLVKYALDYISIKAHPLKENETLDITQSKFLGKPYLPLDATYPKDKQGKPMILLAQLNFSEMPALAPYPDKGILQLFITAYDWYDMEDYEIRYYKNIADYQSDFDFLTSEMYEESPIYCEHKLEFVKKTEYGGSEDFRFDYSFDGLSYWEFYEKLTKQQQKDCDTYFYNTGHKTGGYAYFTQSDPRDYNAELQDDILLLQIDTDENIMFGDAGVAHIFINEKDLAAGNFEKAYFYWDCC